MKRCYYDKTISTFTDDDPDSIFGKLSSAHQHNLEEQQKNAWIKQILILQKILQGLEGKIYFEYAIPRMGKRVDTLLIIHNIIFVIEFKVGETAYPKHAQHQTIDYCLDLKNFHAGSHDKLIVPILVCTKAHPVEIPVSDAISLDACLLCNVDNLRETIVKVIEEQNPSESLDVDTWESSNYKPTPTIIEAAQALFKGHAVEDISRNDAGAINLTKTSQAINRIVDFAKNNGKKCICLLTGVPGAGKTLAGLNIATERFKTDESEHSVFLSGNGPLVKVLQEALARDSVFAGRDNGNPVKKSDAERRAKSFIQNIHHFRDEYLRTLEAPIEKVVVFDEAQRAWQKEQVSKFMRSKKGIEDFEMSEPEYLIGVMDRHTDWCCIICLIGGGQEINTGEAGVQEWISSLILKFYHWEIFYSPKILNERSTYLSDHQLIDWLINNGTEEENLHLGVSVRSFRSEKVAEFVHHLLNNNPESAKKVYFELCSNYPIIITRNLTKAKKWLRDMAKGSERIGITASSGARRMKAEGIDVKNEIDPANWFLNSMDDVRSSYYLEDIATEFDIQGLEIDYACLAWDINLYHDGSCWQFQNFKGSRWQKINQEAAKSFLLNSYRVLMTRARQGMVIFIPVSDGTDPTRPKILYDNTFDYLKQCGISELE